MTDHHCDFPYTCCYDINGDYFHNVQAALDAGYDEKHLWSVVVDDDTNTFSYGPPHHYVNLIGIVGTIEERPEDTYYHETLDV